MWLRYFSWYIYVLLCLNLANIFGQTVEISMLSVADEHFALIDYICTEPIYLEKIVFSADVIFSAQEFKNLSQLEDNTWITPEQLKQACLYIKLKNKFDRLLITKKTGKAGLVLEIKAYGAWTFAKLRLKGSLVGKEQFQHCYNLQSGESFDLARHQHSVVALTQALKDQGYLNAQVTDNIEYDSNTKTVNITLNLASTDCFVIGHNIIAINTREGDDAEAYKRLHKKLAKLCDQELSHKYYNKNLMSKQIDQLKSYVISKGFLSPKIEVEHIVDKKKCSVNLKWSVMLRQKKRYIFFGNHFFTSQQLLQELLIDTAAFWMPPSLLAEDIRSLYKKRGFWSVVVEWKEEQDKFFFVIKEGPRAKISSVILTHNSHALYCHPQNSFFRSLINAKYYEEKLFKKGIDKILTKYMQDGYWDAQITNKLFKPIDNNYYNIVLHVQLGRRRLLSKITIDGYEQLLSQGPFSALRDNKTARPFDVKIIQEQRLWLLNYFQSNGYLYTNIKPELIYNLSGIELKWHITHDCGQVNFGKTVIAGSNKMAPDVLLRQLAYKPGEVWNAEKIEQSLKHLRSLNIFQSVSLTPHNIATAEQEKSIVLKYIPDDPFEIRTRLGFQQMSKDFTSLSGTTYIIGGSFLWKNPGLMADIFRLDADITRYTRNFACSYTIPFVFNQPIQTQFKLYSGRYDQPLMVKTRDRLYKEAHDGFLINFAPSYWPATANMNIGFEWAKLSALEPNLARVIDFEPQLIGQRIPNFFIEPTLFIDRFDNNIDPTRGYFTLIQAKGVFPVGVPQGHFIRLLIEQSFAYPVYKSVIGALRFRFGHIFNRDFKAILPTERFYLGGAYSLRGYDLNMVPPLNIFLKRDGEPVWVPVGGRSMININAELRFPLFKNLNGVIFNDMGVLAQKNITDIMGNKWVGATGFGLRYATPIGPLRFDIGWKWRKHHEHERRYAWYLTLGHAF